MFASEGFESIEDPLHSIFFWLTFVYELFCCWAWHVVAISFHISIKHHRHCHVTPCRCIWVNVKVWRMNATSAIFHWTPQEEKECIVRFPTSYSHVIRSVSILDMSSSWLVCHTINRIVQNNFYMKFDFNFHWHERYHTRYIYILWAYIIIEFTSFPEFFVALLYEQKSIILSHRRRYKKEKK